MNNKILGNKGEKIAGEYLESHGYKIIQRNFRCMFGEIDIIACKQDVVVFAEVKTRLSMKYGRPGAAVDGRKQQKIIKTAQWFLRGNKNPGKHFRFDVLEVLRTPAGQSSINHVQGAFEIS